MRAEEKRVRQSVTLPLRTARRVKTMAKAQKTSATRVLASLVEAGLEAQEAEKRRFFDLVKRYRGETDQQESQRLGNELGRLIFGDSAFASEDSA